MNVIRIKIDRELYESIHCATNPVGTVGGIPIRVSNLIPRDVLALLSPSEVVATKIDP